MEREYFYKIAELCVCSDCCLDYALPMDASKEPDVRIRKGNFGTVYAELTKDGISKGAGFLYRYSGNEATYCYENQGMFQVRDGNLIEYQVNPEVSHAWVVQTILCQCIGGLISQRGMIGIHSSVCIWNDKAFIVSGDSGAGKSTLTANLLRNGAKYMADDVACVEVEAGDVRVKSLVPLRKLCADTLERFQYSADGLVDLVVDEKKGVCQPEEFHSGTEPLSAMFYLKKGNVEEVLCRELNGVEKLKALTKNFYAPGGYEGAMKNPVFAEKLFTFCNIVPIYEIVRPMDMDSTKQCLEAVETLLMKNQ